MKNKIYNINNSIKLIKDFYNTLVKHNIKQYAAESTLFICISIIPFFVLIFSLLRLIIPETLNKSILLFVDILPKGTQDLYLLISDELLSKQDFQLLSFSAITTFWSASKGFRAVNKGLSVIYGIEKKRKLLQNIVNSSLLTLFSFFMFISVLVILIVFNPVMVNYVPAFQTFTKTVFTFVILTVIFYSYYGITVKNVFSADDKNNKRHKYKKFKNLPGAALSALVWILSSSLYTAYLESFSKFSYIYGSLTAIVLVVLLIYFGMTLFLIGAEINVYLTELS